MCEEDRKTALGMYSEIFDRAADQEGLAKAFSSPTRQAVVIARSYDAKARKQQLADAEAYGIDDEEIPEFVEAIERSFEDIGAERFFEPAPAEEPIPAQPEYPAVPAAVVPEEPAFEEPAAEQPGTGMDGVDAFLADLHINELEGAPQESPAETAEEFVIEEPEKELPFDEELFEDSETTLKVQPGLLVVFLLFAIPLGLVAIVLMLALAALCLGLAAGAGVLGVFAVTAAFHSGLDIIADILIALGVAVVLFAIAVLFLWTAIWFCAGAIPGIIRGIKELGEKWCCKEVAV